MAPEKGEGAQVHQGEAYLELLEIGHLADENVRVPERIVEGVTVPPEVIKGRDFLDVCGQHALPLLVRLEAMSPLDPRYDPTLAAIRNSIMRYVQPVSDAE